MNVILIVNDTFRRDYLGCYGNDWIHTPNLDRLVADREGFETWSQLLIDWLAETPEVAFRGANYTHEVNVIREWIGHANLNTTNRYAEITARMKAEALKTCELPPAVTGQASSTPTWQDDAVLNWLASL